MASLWQKLTGFRLLILFVLSVMSGTPALAQSNPPVSLIADSIWLNQSTGLLTASGNVQVFFNGTVLQASRITYNSSSGQIEAEGPIIITDPAGVKFSAEFATISDDMKDGLIRGARLLLADQLQLSSAEARRTAGRFNSLNNVVASSCQVCAERPTPVWQLRARQVLHDEVKQRIYFQNATLELMGFPVFYFPYLRIPSPDVRRASGFLIPTFLSSNDFGNGLKLPYYIVLGPHADATITPTLTIDGAQLLDGEYRHRFRHGWVDVFAGVSVREDAGALERGFVSVAGSFELPNEYRLDFNATGVTDDGFLRQYGYDDTDRLVSELTISRYRNRSYASLTAAVLTSLRDDEPDSTIPLVFPELTYRGYRNEPLLGGKFGYEFNLLGLSREVGQDMVRLGGTLDWDVPFALPYGIRANTFARVDVDAYRVWNNPMFPDRVLFNLHPTVGADLRWPLAMTTSDARHVFEPVVQLIYTGSPGFNDAVPNEDSLLVEFDETNLFYFNRYPGRDATELEWRANLGASYTIHDFDNWSVGVAGGVVLRSNPTTQFSQDILGAVYLDLPDDFSLIGRFLFDENLVSKRTDIEFNWYRDSWDLNGTFVYLAPDPLAGSPVYRGEARLGGSYRFADNWQLDFDWTRDMISNQNIEAGAGLTYGNECIEVGLTVTRRFTQSNIVPATTDIDLVIQLAGFGGYSENKWPAARCSY